jgi:outer membrane protein OmpA-like peptidoglycan-associated protein
MATVISDIIFNSAKLDIRQDQVEILHKDAPVLSDLKTGQEILTTGYTEALGDTKMNKRLSFWQR